MSKENLKLLTNKPAITNEQAAEVLFNCATMLQMAGANEYRIAHYRQAALNMLRLGPIALEIALDEETWPLMGLGKLLADSLITVRWAERALEALLPKDDLTLLRLDQADYLRQVAMVAMHGLVFAGISVKKS